MFKLLKNLYGLHVKSSSFTVHLSSKLNQNINTFNQACLFSNLKSPNICVVPLSHRSIIKLSGEDTLDFLQGLVTNDVHNFPQSTCMYAMILNSKGRVLYDILMYKLKSEETSLLLECQKNCVDDILKTFKLYKLRKKVNITVEDHLNVWQVQLLRSMAYPPDINIEDLNTVLAPPLFNENLDPLHASNVALVLPDPRLTWLGWRVISNGQPCSDNLIENNEYYHNFRHFYGIPEGPNELIQGKSLPLESNIDFMNGISFEKGCYLGQELTARSHFTGMIRKRLMPVIISYNKKNIVSETKLFDAKGSKTGKILSTHDQRHGLALIRLDRQNVLHVTANGVQIRVNKTYWWPKPP